MNVKNFNLFSIASKGISGHLLKESAKRRKSKAMIKEEKKAEEMKQREIFNKLAEYDEMKSKMSEAHKVWEEKENYRQGFENLVDNGVIKTDEAGNVIPVEDPMERESIRSKTKQKRLADMSQQEESKSCQFEFDAPVLDQSQDQMDGLS